MMQAILNLPWTYICLVISKGLAAGIGVGLALVVTDWVRAKRQGKVI